LWTGWKGTRDTRYKCPNCKKPVKNDDVYCHRCGQKLMFPHISFTDYIPGEKQELIVRWDDE
jgi:predicted amidophosphoribosyltransferase